MIEISSPWSDKNPYRKISDKLNIGDLIFNKALLRFQRVTIEMLLEIRVTHLDLK